MADEEGKQEGKGFTVQDRRRFSPDTGEARKDAPEESDRPTRSAPQSEAIVGGAEEAPREPAADINFSTFVISLSTQALMHLGEIANPLSGKVETDVPVEYLEKTKAKYDEIHIVTDDVHLPVKEVH